MQSEGTASPTSMTSYVVEMYGAGNASVAFVNTYH